MVRTERPVNTFMEIYAIKSSSIIIDFTSDNLFLKAGLDLSFKANNFFPELVSRPE